jgi:glucose/arabinose dehydrogenase
VASVLRASLLAALVLVVAVGSRPSAARAPEGVHVLVSGYRVGVFARGLHRPTGLARGPGGRMYATQETGQVVVVPRGSRRPRVLARGFRTPLGLAWKGATLYVSSQGRLDRLVLRGGRLRGRTAVLAGLPYRLHQQDSVVVGPDGRLYLGNGSTCDACAERDPRSAAVLSVRPDGTDLKVFSRGLRNPYGLAFQPGTRRLFVSVNNRDDLGTFEPAESVVVARRRARYGWPACWPSWRRRRLMGSCRGVTRPLAYLEPHSSADGIAFWRGALYVAEWGQYLSHRFGRHVVRVDPRTGRSRVFADGFQHPLALAVDARGGLLVADWESGIIYGIRTLRR